MSLAAYDGSHSGEMSDHLYTSPCEYGKGFVAFIQPTKMPFRVFVTDIMTGAGYARVSAFTWYYHYLITIH